MITDDKLVELYLGLEAEFAALIGPVRFSAAINLRLERIVHLMELLGNPQHTYPTIHVGGTSGKGSTATMAATILAQAGYKTGLHLSPHLQILNERHQINNQVASTTRLVQIFNDIKPAIEQVRAKNPFGAPSYFEAMVALAFCLFQQEAVDIAVIEVGLGGSIDATNVINSEVAVLTNVGFDHTAILGDTLEKIISDKAGIIKANRRVISGVRQPGPRQIVAERSQAKNAILWQHGQDFDYQIHGDDCFTLSLPSRSYKKLKLGMKGGFQIANAACAVAAVEALPGFDVLETAVRQGLELARIPGRMEVMQQNPLVILDGAHNPEKMKAAQEIINTDYADKERIVVLSLKSDKVAEDVLPFALKGVKTLILTEFLVKGLWEPMSPQTLAGLSKDLHPNLEIQIVPDPLEAIQLALSLAAPDDLVWVTGSLYLVGDIREYWYPTPRLLKEAEKYLSGALTPL